MSGTAMRTGPGLKKRSVIPTVAAVVGLVLAAGWVMAMRQLRRAHDETQHTLSLQRAGATLELLRAATQARVVADAQMLAQDPRLQSTLAVSNVDDATILDILQDLQKLNSQALFAVLTPAGKVRVQLGAPKLQGLDLSTSAVVKAALEREDAALGTWLVDERVAEVAVIAVRAGDRPVALLAIGNRLDDAQLSALSLASGTHLALVVDDQPVWTDATLPMTAWSGPSVASFEVKGSVPPTRFVASVASPATDPTERLVWAVPFAALLFAVLAFWRGGAK